MTDGIIKGTGNSRYLKSVANFMALYPTYEAFAQALIAGTLPVDLYGVNAGGWQVRGNDLNKASLLKDATASLYGKGTAATVDDILAAIRPLITTAQSTAEGRVLVDTYSYVGDGVSGETSSKPHGCTFAFVPKLYVVMSGDEAAVIVPQAKTGFHVRVDTASGANYPIDCTLSGRTLYWYSRYRPMNTSGRTYYGVAFG